MTEKWEIRELMSDEFSETQLRYAVYDEFKEMVSVHYWEEDAKQMASVPLMLEALETLTAAVQEAFNQARAAIASAKGE